MSTRSNTPGLKSPGPVGSVPVSNVCGVLPPSDEMTELSELYQILEAQESGAHAYVDTSMNDCSLPGHRVPVVCVEKPPIGRYFGCMPYGDMT